MMKKKILLAFMLLIMVFMLCACGMESVEKKEETSFKVYDIFRNGHIIVDTQTNVMYWMSTGTNNYGSLTLLVEKDGSPKIYKDGDV